MNIIQAATLICFNNIFSNLSARKSAPPLDLAMFAGYEKLTEKEREVCTCINCSLQIVTNYYDNSLCRIAEQNSPGLWTNARQFQLIVYIL